jgi:3-isopropylmalate/(R)-2-methylmalate dehydratase small subunit
MIIKGKIWKYGDNVNTDYIIPGRYMELTDPEEMTKHVFEEHDPLFRSKIKKGDIIVGANNFGCGSSREHAALALKYIGVGSVIAESFARIFFRNCINIGLPALECPGIIKSVNFGDEIEVNLTKGIIKKVSSSIQLNFNPLPIFMIEVLKAGGLDNYLKNIDEW